MAKGTGTALEVYHGSSDTGFYERWTRSLVRLDETDAGELLEIMEESPRSPKSVERFK